MNILVTGSASFIGAYLVLRLLDCVEPLKIVGLDRDSRKLLKTL